MSTQTLAPPPTEEHEDLRALALRHGLSVSGARPSLPEYARQLWSRRHFITAFATATSKYTGFLNRHLAAATAQGYQLDELRYTPQK